MNDNSHISTYILRGDNNYYCGKTIDIDRRMSDNSHITSFCRISAAIKIYITAIIMRQHKNDRQCRHSLVWITDGDHEKQIKAFGVARFYKLIISGRLLS